MDLLGTSMAYRALAATAAGAEDYRQADAYLARAMVNAQRRQSRHEVAKTNLFRIELLGHLMSEPARERLTDDTRAAFSDMKMNLYLARTSALRAGEHANAG